jgi:hypothetical protein
MHVPDGQIDVDARREAERRDGGAREQRPDVHRRDHRRFPFVRAPGLVEVATGSERRAALPRGRRHDRTIFVRQPVTLLSVSRPSVIGECGSSSTGRRAPTVTAARAAPGRAGHRRRRSRRRRVAVVRSATNTLTAHGGVTPAQDTTLTADEVVYDRTNGIVEARGHVVLTEPRPRWKAISRT